LHQYANPQAPEVREFLRAHAGDPVFLQRAETLNRVFKLKEEMVQCS
jgi:hypothetical protein